MRWVRAALLELRIYCQAIDHGYSKTDKNPQKKHQIHNNGTNHQNRFNTAEQSEKIHQREKESDKIERNENDDNGMNHNLKTLIFNTFYSFYYLLLHKKNHQYKKKIKNKNR